jgi:hypothetical protein
VSQVYAGPILYGLEQANGPARAERVLRIPDRASSASVSRELSR